MARVHRSKLGVAGAVCVALVTLRVASGCTTGSPAAPNGTNVVSIQRVDDAGPVDAGPEACTQPPIPDGGPLRLRGKVVEAQKPDASTEPKPIPNAMISVEYGGIYIQWCDLSKASPYYLFGAMSDDAGRFEIDVKEGVLGFHSFANDYYYGRATVDTTEGNQEVVMKMEPLPAAQAQPTVRAAGFDKTDVAPGELVTYGALLATWDPKDPLSDENLLVEPTRGFTIELDPPRRGKKDDFADGLWQRTFPAPSAPGTYTYWFSATTSTCITSELVTSTLTVR